MQYFCGICNIEQWSKNAMEGFGVFQVPEAAVCEQAVSDALAAGDRLIANSSYASFFTTYVMI